MQIINVIDFNIIKAVCYTNTYVRQIGAVGISLRVIYYVTLFLSVIPATFSLK